MYLEFHPALNDAQLSGPNHHPIRTDIAEISGIRLTNSDHSSLSKLRLDVQAALLRQNQHVSVGVTERLLVHGLVGEIHMNREAFM